MTGGGMRAFTICSVFLVVACEAGWRADLFETQIKTVTVVDANGIPVPDARVYRGGCLVWDNQAKAVRPTGKTPWRRTDDKGTVSFHFDRWGAGSPYFVTDASFERMTNLFIAREDPNESYTVRLEKLARIRGMIRNADAALSGVHVELLFDSTKDLFPFLSTDYCLGVPSHELTFDIPCPAGCNLSLCIDGREPALTEYYGVYRDIAALKPSQVLDIGSIELSPTSGLKVISKSASELQVADWVTGEPVTLAELKGKVVLIYFWSVFYGECHRVWPGLVELHEKYADDGLVIIAVHDASQMKASLLDKSGSWLDLPNIPFRIAVDSPMEGAAVSVRALGTGRTLAAYGVTEFPTSLIISKDGRVGDARRRTEEHIYLLLYGRPMPQPTRFQRLLADNPLLFVVIAATTTLILILGTVLGVLRLRHSKT